MALEGQAHRLVVQIGDGDLQLVLLHKGGGVAGLGHPLEVGGERLVGHLNLHALVGELQGQGIVVGLVGAHGHAEAGVVAAVALHQGEFDLLPHPLIIEIRIAAVARVDLRLHMLGVDVAGAGQNQDGLLGALAGAVLILGEVEDGLLDGGENLLGRVIGLDLPHDVLIVLYFRVPDDIRIRVAALLGEALRGIDAVVLFERLQNGLCLYGVQRVTHAESLLIELSSP